MKHLGIMTLGLLAPTLAAGLCVAAPNTDNTQTSTETAAGKATDKDFGRLSVDGATAFADVHLARVAIFDGNTTEAGKLVADAQSSLDKAKMDNATFMRAESDLHTPPQAASANNAATNTAATNKTANDQAAKNTPAKTTPIAWIPIDGQLVVGETYQPTTKSDAAVATAKKNLQNGEGDKAMQAIKLAAIDVDYTLVVAPLNQSIADVNQANALIASGDYYGASQALKKAEDGIRYDEIDDVGKVRGQAKTAAANGNG
jgi:cytoskeletal protein RodZ